MRRKTREIRDQITLAIAFLMIVGIMAADVLGAIIKTDEQRDCERWERQYHHDYCND